MKLTRYAALAAVVVSLIPFGQSAFAQSTDATGAVAPPAASVNTGKTRAEVRAELIQAEQQGTIPVSKNNYPPTPDEIAQNRAEYQVRHVDNRVNMAVN
jgi:hypothetical protein